jgi:hypothetical protein
MVNLRVDCLRGGEKFRLLKYKLHYRNLTTLRYDVNCVFPRTTRLAPVWLLDETMAWGKGKGAASCRPQPQQPGEGGGIAHRARSPPPGSEGARRAPFTT